MSLALAQAIAPTPTTAGSSITFTYVPLAVNNIVNMQVNTPNAGLTLNSVSSAAGQVAWTIGSTAAVTVNASNHIYSVGGVIRTAASHVVTCTFSAAPGTCTIGIVELVPTIPGLVNWIYITFTTNTGTATAAVTTALAGGQVNDAFVANFLTANAVTGNSNAQGFLTYDQTDEAVYGQLTSAATVPATGFTQTSGIFYANAILFRPGIAQAKVPQLITPYQGMF